MVLAVLSREQQEGKACLALLGTMRFETPYIHQELGVRNLWGCFPDFLTTSLLISGLYSASVCMYSTPYLPPSSQRGKIILDISVFLLITSTNLVCAD